MRFTRFIPLILAAGLLAGCTATPAVTESSAPSASSTTAGDEITSSSRVTTFDEALAFAATITPETQSAKYEVVNTAGKLRTLGADELTPEIDAQLAEIAAAATATTTKDELAEQITALQDVVATINAAR